MLIFSLLFDTLLIYHMRTEYRLSNCPCLLEYLAVTTDDIHYACALCRGTHIHTSSSHLFTDYKSQDCAPSSISYTSSWRVLPEYIYSFFFLLYTGQVNLIVSQIASLYTHNLKLSESLISLLCRQPCYCGVGIALRKQSREKRESQENVLITAEMGNCVSQSEIDEDPRAKLVISHPLEYVYTSGFVKIMCTGWPGC